jgi:hypothetical protein
MPPSPRTQAAPHPDRRRDRATSPVIDAIAGAARALSPVSFLLKPRVGRQNEFPEDDEEDEHQSQYQSFASMGGSGDGGERLYDGSFLSATTVAGDSSVGEGSRSFGASGATGSNYSFQEEERLMREIEEKKRTAAKKGKSGVGGWFSSLAGVGSSQPKSPIDPPQTPPHTSESQDDDESSELEPEEEGEEEEEEFRPGGELSDEEEVPIKTTSRLRPRVSHDNQAFKYQPGDLASENSESDGDGGRRRRRRKSGSLGRLRAEGMVPVMEGKKRKGKKGSRRNTAGGSAEMVDDDEEEEDDADETFDGAQYHQDRAPDETDESFVIQMHQQERQRQASHQPLVSTQSKKPFFASSSPLPTHFKTRSGPLHLLQRILAFVYTFLLSIGRKVVRAPLEMADGTRTSLGLVDWGQAMRVLGAALLLGTIASLINPSISSSRTSIPLAHNHSTHHHPSSASSWNPFRAQPSTPSTSSPSYKTPDLPPDSMDELLSRLTSLESALGFLSSQTSASTYSAADADSRLSTVDSRLSSELRRLSTVISQHSQEEKVRLQSLDRVVGRIRGDVDALNGRVKSIAKKTEENEEVVAKLDVSVEGVKTAVKGLTERVKEAERVAKEASDANRIAEIATEAIEGYLPSKLVVKLNPKTKQLDVDPAFWTALRSVFVEQSQLAPAVSSEVDKLRSSLAPSWKSSPSPPTPVVVHQPTPPAPPPTWSDFLASNEAALHAWSEAELEQQAQTGAVVSRKTFLDILHRELESLKVDLSRHVDQSSQQLSSDILAKSRQASEALVDSKLASHQPASSSPPSSSSSSDPQISTSLLQTLIDSALLKYSKDTLARTDFALYTAGGRVIPSITSDTYEISTASSPSFFDRLIPGKSKGSITGRPPVTALHPDTNLGNCWPFKGASGQLGVLLARPAVVRAVTVEHAAREVSLDMAAAPRDVESAFSSSQGLVPFLDHRFSG